MKKEHLFFFLHDPKKRGGGDQEYKLPNTNFKRACCYFRDKMGQIQNKKKSKKKDRCNVKFILPNKRGGEGELST